MRNLFSLIILFLIASAIYSCSKGNPTTTTLASVKDDKTKTLLIGKWMVTGDTLLERQAGVVTSFNIINGTPGTFFNLFNSDGTWEEISTIPRGPLAPVYGVKLVNYTLKSDVITFVHAAATYTLNGGTITGVDQPYSQKAYIKSLTNNSLLLYYTDTVTTSKGYDVVVEERYRMTK